MSKTSRFLGLFLILCYLMSYPLQNEYLTYLPKTNHEFKFFVQFPFIFINIFPNENEARIICIKKKVSRNRLSHAINIHKKMLWSKIVRMSNSLRKLIPYALIGQFLDHPSPVYVCYFHRENAQFYIRRTLLTWPPFPHPSVRTLWMVPPILTKNVLFSRYDLYHCMHLFEKPKHSYFFLKYTMINRINGCAYPWWS